MATKPHPKDWAAPYGYWGGLGLGFGLSAIGLLFQRFDLALLGMPLLLATLLARNSRPTARTLGRFQQATPDDDIGSETAEAGNSYWLAIPAVTSPRVHFAQSDAAGVEYIQARLYSLGHRPTTIVTTPRHLHLLLNSKRTGPHPTFTAQVRGYGSFGMWIEDFWTADAPEAVGLPNSHPLGILPAPTKLRG